MNNYGHGLFSYASAEKHLVFELLSLRDYLYLEHRFQHTSSKRTFEQGLLIHSFLSSSITPVSLNLISSFIRSLEQIILSWHCLLWLLIVQTVPTPSINPPKGSPGGRLESLFSSFCRSHLTYTPSGGHSSKDPTRLFGLLAHKNTALITTDGHRVK